MLLDRVVETTDVTGTGTMNLLGAATISSITMRRFGAVVTSTKPVYYLIIDATGNFEYGRGVYTSGSPDTLTRASILRSSNSDAAVNFSAGTKYVYAAAGADVLRFGAQELPTLAGTADARTMTNAAPLKALITGMMFAAINGAAANATTTPTIQVDSLTAKTVVKPDNTALAAGDMPASTLLLFFYDGTSFRLLNAAAMQAATEAETNATASAGTALSGKAVTPQGLGRWTGAIAPPQGRLTLTSATPVLTGDVAGAGTVYYALYNGQLVPIYDGTRWSMFVFAELSNILANSSTGKAGPAAAANNSNYDMFVWNDSGTLRLTRGPAWSSDTARGTGAGTTELQRTNGLWTNKVAITNGPGAGLGTYVGTIRTNGSATVDMKFGTLAASGGEARICVWNAYNRVEVAAMVRDTTDSWTLAAVSTRSANNSATNRVSMVRGLDEDAVVALYASASGNPPGQCSVGIGVDSTSTFSGWQGLNATASALSNVGGWSGLPGLGFHYIQALESSQLGGTATFYGDSGASTKLGILRGN